MQPKPQRLMDKIAENHNTNTWFVIEKPRENTVILFNPGLKTLAELRVNDENNEYQEGKPIPYLLRALE